MRSASPSNLRLQLAHAPGVVWGRTRSTLAGGVVWSTALVFLFTFFVARSTATAGWVPGIETVTVVAVGGALLMGVLALLPIPWGAALGAGLLLGPVVAAAAALPQLIIERPFDPVSTRLLSIWWGRITAGTATDDPGFYLYLICWLMWITGGWLSWCVLRWRRPLLGLVPGAAAFATNLLNYPDGQNGYTLAILVLMLALLLWTNYTASIASAVRARVKLMGDARWDFWESGLVAMAALIVLAIMLPPLSTADRTVQMEASAFSNWAQLQQRLSHGVFGRGQGGVGTVGFSTDVVLSRSVKRTRDIVFTYKSTDFSGLPYFRGVNVTDTAFGQWRYASDSLKYPLAKNAVPRYSEDYQKLAAARFEVKMLSPPNTSLDTLFYPGQLYTADRQTYTYESSPVFLPAGVLTTLDRLQSVSLPTSAGSYTVTIDYSIATDTELRAAGASYPPWLTPYTGLRETGYRSPEVLKRIRDLALRVTAGVVTPYDKAVAIESYLRDLTTFTYDLNTSTPPGVDPIDYFLFTSHRGYCEFFATAMGDMLRSLGIPTRLVNGYGPGTFDSTLPGWVVRSFDAHTWVESFFPTYGWIPFEPTPDGFYGLISRSVPPGANLCRPDQGCITPPVAGATKPDVVPSPVPRTSTPNPTNSGGGPTFFSFKVPDAGTLTKIAGVLLALVLLLFAATSRYLRPRTVMTAWKRMDLLTRLAGAERRPGETPLELGRRLAETFPEASDPVRALAGGFVVAAYAPPELAETGRTTVMEAWSALCPFLLRRIAARLRLTRA